MPTAGGHRIAEVTDFVCHEYIRICFYVLDLSPEEINDGIRADVKMWMDRSFHAICQLDKLVKDDYGQTVCEEFTDHCAAELDYKILFCRSWTRKELGLEKIVEMQTKAICDKGLKEESA